jgi:hypothetical protein
MYWGRLNSSGEIINPNVALMTPGNQPNGDTYNYQTPVVVCGDSGLHGFTIRALPCHPDLLSSARLGLVSWASAFNAPR